MVLLQTRINVERRVACRTMRVYTKEDRMVVIFVASQVKLQANPLDKSGTSPDIHLAESMGCHTP